MSDAFVTTILNTEVSKRERQERSLAFNIISLKTLVWMLVHRGRGFSTYHGEALANY